MKEKLLCKNAGLYIILSVLFLVPNFFPIHLVQLDKTGIKGEKFDPTLVPQIRSVKDMLAKADAMVCLRGSCSDSLNYAIALTELIKNRFYHGYSYYSLQQNWIASVAGKTLWSHLSAIVLPDDILKYPMAACSQQAIVFMACLKQKGITYRKVGFDHHYALEAKIGGRWYYFDPNLEPDFSKIPRSSIASLIQNKALYSIYKNRFDSTEVDNLLAHQFYGRPNEDPAPQASFFHRATKILSRTLFLFPLLLVYAYSKKRSKQVSQANQITARPVLA